MNVWNAGGATIAYDIEIDSTWLIPSPGAGTSAGEVDEITVNYSTNLGIGLHQASLIFHSSQPGDSPIVVPFTLDIIADTTARVSSLPGSFELVGAVGREVVPVRFGVWNSGTGPDELYYALSSDSEWLRPSPEGGTSSGKHDPIDILFDTSSLAVGEHQGWVRIESPGFSIPSLAAQVVLSIRDDLCFGDLDEDGARTAADREALINHILSHAPLTGSARAVADINGDASIDVRDLVLLNGHLAAGAPLPSCP